MGRRESMSNIDIPRCGYCNRECADLELELCPYCLGKKPLDIPKEKVFSDTDKINPSHYRSHPSGIECIEVTRHMSFNIGNAIKYLWRFDLKNGVEDLKKAVWYIQDEIKQITAKAGG